MKVKASLILNAVGILKAIDLTKMKLSTAYLLRNMLKECQVAVEDFEQRRIAIAEEHGTLNKEENKFDFETDEDHQAFQKALIEVMEDEIDIKIEKIDLDLIDDYVEIEPTNIPFVEWFIDFK